MRIAEEIIIEVKRSINELKYKGFEVETFFDRSSEFHREAYEEVLYEAAYKIEEEILDEAEVHLSSTYFGDLAYNIIRRNVREKALDLAEECIEDLYFNN